MKKYYKILMMLVVTCISSAMLAQGVTTSGINGKVVDENNEALLGATVVLTETSTGTVYGTITDLKGNYRLDNVNVGGPYTLKISFIGYGAFEKKDIFLSLGQTQKFSVQLQPSTTTLATVEIIAQRNDIFDGNRTGAATVVGAEKIKSIPTVTRQISDMVRMTPQALIGDDNSISIAGINNRYNAISIDGAVNNDVFGLAATGTNGGQTGGTSISMDAIDQFQIAIAPYDVRQSGFAGASINAVTKRGRNEFFGSAYFFYRNQRLAGKTPWEVVKDDEEPERSKLAPFTAKLYGASIGGPIIKDKLFFFINAEVQKDETPYPFNFNNYTGNLTQADLQDLVDKLATYGYDPGGYLDNADKLDAKKFIARIDWNINKNHKLTVRHSYAKNEQYDPYASNSRSIEFYNAGVYFPSITNSSSLELKSQWDKFSNSLIIGATWVRDDRDPMGSDFPSVTIKDGGAKVYFGSEVYSTGNKLDQDVYTITDNFNYYYGNHTLTAGFNFEYSKSYNLFMRKAFGQYTFDSLEDFLTGQSASYFDHSYSLVDDIAGDGSAAAAEFDWMQLGAYIQDEWQINDNFKLTAGLRIDIPMFPDDPKYDAATWAGTKAMIEDAGWDLLGANAGKMPKNRLMFSPRIGFNWDVSGGEKTTQLRGGAGLFVSRIPLVWPGGAYNNNGVMIGGVTRYSNVFFNPDPYTQYTQADFGGEDTTPSGQLDIFAEDFKFPKTFKVSLAVDQKLPGGVIGTLEVIYSKYINNVLYYNVNNNKSTANLTGGTDNRPIFEYSTIDNRYSRIMLGANTDKGHSWNFTTSFKKSFNFGLKLDAAYSFGMSKSINDGLSSQNSSQWKYVANVRGYDDLDLSYSTFDPGHRIIASATYKKDLCKNFGIEASLVYDGQSGRRFSYVYSNSAYNGLNSQESNNDYALLFVPAYKADINLIEKNGLSPDQQWRLLEKFIGQDDYLKHRRGQYAERFGARLPFESIFDFKFAANFYINAGGQKHTLQLTADIFNFANFLNKKWGVRRYIPYGTYELITFEGFEDDGTTPQYSFTKDIETEDIYDIDDSGYRSSRWQMQVGIRYIFGKY